VALDRIESDLGRGLAREIVFARYNITEALLAAHEDVCLAPPTPESILSNAVALQRAALRVLNDALTKNDIKAAMTAFDKADRALTTVGKLVGAFASESPLVDARQQNINVTLGALSIEELRQLAAPES
jgi:hypothetical protein